MEVNGSSVSREKCAWIARDTDADLQGHSDDASGPLLSRWFFGVGGGPVSLPGLSDARATLPRTGATPAANGVRCDPRYDW